MVRVQCWIVTACLLVGGRQLAAQGRTPVQDLLASARAAINDLQFARADSITQAILAQNLRRSERIQALQLSAGALFPEEEPGQRRDRALESLRQLVRIAPSAELPREVSWPGLEALHREARLSTFGASASPRDQLVVTGPEESAEVDVVTSRPARLTLRLEPAAGGVGFLLDSLAINSRAIVHFRVLSNGKPRFVSGNYRLVVMAVDNIAPDTIRLAYSAVLTAPPLEYVEVPAQIDPGSILPVKTLPKRSGGVIAGVVAMASTILLSRVFRDDPLKSASKTDGRAIPIGIALGIGTAGGVWALDKGAPIPANVAANERTRAEFARRVTEARAKNADLLRTYHAELKLDPEVKP